MSVRSTTPRSDRRTRFVACAAAVLAAAVCSGCGGGGSSQLHCLAGDPFCGSVLYSYALVLAPSSDPATPIAVGTSTTMHVTEELCVGTGSQSGPPPGVQLGCRTPFVPDALSVTVDPMSNGAPCPVTTSVSAGTVTVSRYAPGDPRLFGSSGTSGFCRVEVADPTKSSGAFNVHPSASFLV